MISQLDRLPDKLLFDLLTKQVVIDTRQSILISDPPGAPQSLAASTTILGSAFSDATPSNPVFGTPGVALPLGGDDAILIENVSFTINSADVGGLLAVYNLNVFDAASRIFPVAGLLASLPYQFAAVIGDGLDVACSFFGNQYLARATQQNTAQQLMYFVGCRYILKNNDAGAAHTYRRFLRFEYRVIHGIGPLMSKIYNLTD